MDKQAMKNKPLVLIVLGLMLLSSIVCAISILQSHHADVPLEDLLVREPSFPSSWKTATKAISVDWKVSTDSFSLKSGTFFALSNLGRIWTDGGGISSNPQISQNLFQYDSPLSAELHYWLSSPEIAYGDKWPNFAFSDNFSNRYPPDWEYHSDLADREHVACAMGVLNQCQLWYYWARYGQYVMEIEFFGPSKGVNAESFAQIVKQIDTDVAQRLLEP